MTPTEKRVIKWVFEEIESKTILNHKFLHERYIALHQLKKALLNHEIRRNK